MGVMRGANDEDGWDANQCSFLIIEEEAEIQAKAIMEQFMKDNPRAKK